MANGGGRKRNSGRLGDETAGPQKGGNLVAVSLWALAPGMHLDGGGL
jgi:hypothetical protein